MLEVQSECFQQSQRPALPHPEIDIFNFWHVCVLYTLVRTICTHILLRLVLNSFHLAFEAYFVSFIAYFALNLETRSFWFAQYR